MTEVRGTGIRRLATVLGAGAIALASACSAPKPDLIEAREVDFRVGQEMTLDLPADRATIFASTDERAAVRCQATGPGDAPSRVLELFQARDVDNPPVERDGRRWSQVGSITEGPGTVKVTCTGPEGTPLFADIRLNAS